MGLCYMMLNDKKAIEKILRENRKRFECSEFMFAEDSNLSPYSGENLRVLVLFLSNGKFRSSSNTFNALHSIATSCDVFMDYCYMPHADDIPILDELGVPFLRGARSGFLLKDFDVVLVSIAVLKEVVNLPVVYKHEGIPFGANGRKEGKYPLFVMGGSSATVLSIACGDFLLDGYRDRSLVDLVNYGKGEKSLRELFLTYGAMVSSGSIDREALFDSLSSRFLIPSRLNFIYDAKGYIVGETSGQQALLDVGDGVDSNFSDKIVNLDGSFGTRGDLLISSGCSGRGSCSFCLDKETRVLTESGMLTLRQIGEGKATEVMTDTGIKPITNYIDSGVKEVFRIEFSNGSVLDLTKDHKVKIFSDDQFVWKQVKDIQEGDYAFCQQNSGIFGKKEIPLSDAELMGRIIGDGSYSSGTIRLSYPIQEKDKCRELIESCGLQSREIEARGLGGRCYIYKGKEFLRKYGFHSYENGMKIIPEVVYEMTKESQSAFLRGLFDSDGQIFKVGCVALTNKNIEFLREIQKLLLNLGIQSKVKSHTYVRAEDVKNRFKEGEATIARLIIFGVESHKRYLDLIGFSAQDKRERLENRKWGHSLSNIVPLSLSKRKEIAKNFGSRKFGHLCYKGKNGSLRGFSSAKLREVPHGFDSFIDYINDNGLVFYQVVSITSIGEREVCDINVGSEEHSFIANGFVVHNCLEGSVGGCWKEKSLKDLEMDIFELKSNSWCESVGIFSYNANYHTNISNIAELTKKYFERSSLLASRADVYANEPEFLEICRGLGSIKLSIASEGMSERIRNDFLNKRLSRDEYYRAVENIMGDRILTLKINYILTGRETEADFEEWLEDMKHFSDRKAEMGYVTRISITITNLVIYDLTSLKYEARTMAMESYRYNESSFIQTFLSYIEKIKELGVGIKLYGVGGVSAFDQLILDLGFMGTSILINSVVKDGLYYDKEITRNMCDRFFQRVELAYKIEDIFKERESSSWFPSSLITFHQKNEARGVKESYKDYSCESCINPYKSNLS